MRKIVRAEPGNINKIQKIFKIFQSSSRGISGLPPGGTDQQFLQKEGSVNFVAKWFTLTKDFLGLGNVTDDSQLKRSAGDFTAFTQKISPVVGDSLLGEDSADGNNKKRITLEGIKNLFLSFFAPISSRDDHGTITTSVTIGSETEHTMDHTVNIILNLDNLTAGKPSRALRDTVSGGGSPNITISSSQSIVFRGTDTLSGLTDGEHDILFTWDGVRVLVRVEAL